MAGIVTAHRKPDDQKMLKLDRLYVHPIWQRKGAGTLLLNQAISTFSNIRMVSVDVATLNQGAIIFYTKNGFNVSDESGRTVEGKILKIVVMTKEIIA